MFGNNAWLAMMAENLLWVRYFEETFLIVNTGLKQGKKF